MAENLSAINGFGGFPSENRTNESNVTSPVQRVVNPKSKKLYDLFFDTPEKCQMAINAIKAGQIGDVSEFDLLLRELESRKMTLPNGRCFTTQEQKKMSESWDYPLKELRFVLDEDRASKNNVYSNDKPYLKVIQGLTSAKECQAVIDTILDKGKLKGFDTKEEVRKLLEMLETKKSEFQAAEIATAEDTVWRKKMHSARKTNNFVFDVLDKEQGKIHSRQHQIADGMSNFEAAGTKAWSLVSGGQDPYEELYSHASKLHKPIIELCKVKNLLTEEEFAAKANELFGEGSYDLNLVKKVVGDYDKYISAIKISKFKEVLDLENNSENLGKIEEMFGGKEFLGQHILNYGELSEEDKIQTLKNLVSQEINALSSQLGGVSGDDVQKEYLKNYSKFLQDIGVSDLNKSLDDFKERSETAGAVLKGTTVMAAFLATGGLVAIGGGALVAAATTAKASAATIFAIKTATAVATGTAVGTTDFGIELLDRDLHKKEKFNKALNNGEIKDIAAHSAITGGFAAATFGASAVIAEGGIAAAAATKTLSPVLRSGMKMFAVDAGFGLAELASHNAYEGRNLTDISGKEVALVLGTSFAVNSAAVVGATKAARSNVKKAGNVKVKQPVDDNALESGSSFCGYKQNASESRRTSSSDSSGSFPKKENIVAVSSTLGNDFDNFLADSVNNEVAQALPQKPTRPIAAQAEATPVVETTVKNLYKEQEAFVVLPGDSLRIGGVEVTSELLEKAAMTKSGRLGNKAKYTRTMLNLPEGSAIHVKKAENGYVVTVKGGEVEYVTQNSSVQVLSDNVVSKQPMGQDIQTNQVNTPVVPPRQTVVKAAQSQEYINERVSAISDLVSMEGNKGYVKLPEFCVEAVDLAKTRVKLGNTEAYLSDIEGLSTKLSKAKFCTSVPVYSVNGEFSLNPPRRFGFLTTHDAPAFYVTRGSDGAVILTRGSYVDVSATNVQKPELWRKDAEFEKLTTKSRVVPENIEFKTIDGNRFTISDINGIAKMEEGTTYHVVFNDSEGFSVASLEYDAGSTGVFVRKVGDKIEAFGSEGRGPGIMTDDAYHRQLNEFVSFSPERISARQRYRRPSSFRNRRSH